MSSSSAPFYAVSGLCCIEKFDDNLCKNKCMIRCEQATCAGGDWMMFYIRDCTANS